MLTARTHSWQSVLEPQQVSQTFRIAEEVAGRLRVQEKVEVAIASAAQQTQYPRSVHWQGYGVAQGYAGLALMCGYLDACFPRQEWASTAHSYLQIAAQDAQKQHFMPLGMFSGLAGLAFTTWYLSQRGKRYHKFLRSLEEVLLPRAILSAKQFTAQKKDIWVGQFDLISGLSGLGAYLLSRKEDPEVHAALQEVLKSLVALAEDDQQLPRWYTPFHLLGDEKTARFYPNGNLNCGLAHGIPGPLGLLALAQCAGVTVDGMEEAIARVADWLLHHRLDDRWGCNWPTALRVERDGSVGPHALSTDPFGPSRTAWCYGSPGLARALWFASEALNRTEYRMLAIEAMEAVYRRPLGVRRIDSPTFCHGIAGLLQITLRFAYDTQLPQFAQAARALHEQLLSLYTPDALLGYYSLESGENKVDQPGLLDGIPGIVLALLASASPVEPVWDRLFLLS